MENALVPLADEKAKESTLKQADRGGIPNKKPPWWSTQEYGLPMDFDQKHEPRPVINTKRLLSADQPALEDARRAPGIVDLAKIKARDTALLVEEKKVPPTRLVEIEQQLRNEVARHTPYHERKTTILIRAFQTFDHERKGTLNLDAFRRAVECFNVSLTPAEGRALFRKFGQDGQRRLPYQVFTRALFTSKSRLLAWTRTHYMDSRAKNGLPKGSPFVQGATVEQKVADRLFDAKIQPLSSGPGHSVTGVYPPSNWAMDTWEKEGLVHPVVRARQPPDIELELEHIYGYNGCCEYGVLQGKQYLEPVPSVVAPNLFYTSTMEVVYSTAATGVVLKWKEDDSGGLSGVEQRFFRGHTNDILCLTIDKSRNYCATGQAPIAKKCEGHDVDPFVCIWDVHSTQELIRLHHRPEVRQVLDPLKPPKKSVPGVKEDGCGGIQAVEFSEAGDLLISACRNPKSTVMVWKWRFAQLVYRVDTKSGVPPQIYNIKWNPVEKADGSKAFDFAIYGNKFITFWMEDPAPLDPQYPRSWSAEPGSFINMQDPGGTLIVQDVFSCEFLRNGNVVTGMSDGNIYVWKPVGQEPNKPAKMMAERRVMIPGADPSQPKTRAHVHTVQVLKIRYVRTDKGGDAIPTLLSGGGGGTIKVWKDLDGEVPVYSHTVELPRDPGIRAKAPPAAGSCASHPPANKALDCFPGCDDLIVGTDKCDIYKLKLVAKPDGSFEPMVPTLLVKGNAAHTDGICAHPTREHIFCSAAYSDKLCIWDAKGKALLGRASCKGRQATCCEFRSDGKHLAVGTAEGCVFVFRELNDWEGDSLRLARVPEMGVWPIRDCTQGIHDLRYSPDLRTLAVASHEQMIDLYDCADSKYLRLTRCRGHSATVMHIDWAVDSKMLQSQCNAYELLYWNTDRGDAPDGWEPGQPSPFRDRRKRENYGRQILEDQRDQQWATWTCCFGFDVLGIWPPGYINPDINMVARSPRLESDGPNPKQYVAVADNNSGVMILNYPAVVNKQPCHYNLGHASHVGNVRWMVHKDEDGVEQLRLISAGGHDRALFQWKVNRLTPPVQDDPTFRGNMGRFQDAQFAWYYKYTGNKWDGNPSSFTKALRVYHANTMLAEAREQAEAAKSVNAKGGPAIAGPKSAAGKSEAGKSGSSLTSDSATLRARAATIEEQEAKLAEQQRLIEDLQKQLQTR